MLENGLGTPNRFCVPTEISEGANELCVATWPEIGMLILPVPPSVSGLASCSCAAWLEVAY